MWNVCIYKKHKGMMCKLDCAAYWGCILYNRVFLKKNKPLADFKVGVKIIQILSSPWWHFITATSSINIFCPCILLTWSMCIQLFYPKLVMPIMWIKLDKFVKLFSIKLKNDFCEFWLLTPVCFLICLLYCTKHVHLELFSFIHSILLYCSPLTFC